MSELHLFLIVQNHCSSLKKNAPSFKSLATQITVLDLNSTDGSFEFLIGEGFTCERCRPEDLSMTINRLSLESSAAFAMVMYGNETLRGNVIDQLSLIETDTLAANISVRAPSWSNDILSRDDFFLEPRVIRTGGAVPLIGTAQLYPLIEPTAKMMTLSAAIDRELNSQSIINTEPLYRAIADGLLKARHIKTTFTMVMRNLWHCSIIRRDGPNESRMGQRQR